MDADGGDVATVAKSNKEKRDEKKKEEEMNEEDRALKEGLEVAVERLTENNAELHKPSLEHLVKEIRDATSSMTSVPKPLKFLRPHYATLKGVYETWPAAHEMKELMADVLSVLAMTMAESGSRECLKYKLEGTKVDIAKMGQEYLRSLSGEIALEYMDRVMTQGVEDPEATDLMVLVDDIIPFQMKHNAETEAVDLLLEVQKLDKLLDSKFHVDDRNYERVCLYLLKTADFIADPDDISEIFATAYAIYLAQGKFTGALRVALKMDDTQRIGRLFRECTIDVQKKQMAYMLGRHKSSFRTDDETYDLIIGNSTLAETFKSVARNLDVAEPKHPEDIFKTHLQAGGNLQRRNAAVDSNQHNLASTFVNAFINAGTGADKLMTVDDSSWVHKVKHGGKISAVASMGMTMLWDVEEGFNKFDKYINESEPELKAGACLGIGMLCHGVDDDDMAFALLTEFLESNDPTLRIASILGLGLAYGGQRREDLMELCEDVITNDNKSIAEVSLAALSLGMVHVGNCEDDAAGILVQKLMELDSSGTEEKHELDDGMSRFLCLGLGLIYLGHSERCEAVLEALKTVAHPRGQFAQIVLEACAYAGTGNVLQIQQMLRVCAEHIEDPKKAQHQMAAVIGIALVALGEEVGTEMCLRTFDHLLHYGEIPVKRTVPLGMAMLYVSNPDYSVVDQLSRLSHDADQEVAMNAIFSLGIVAAGTNNSRVAGMLRQLSEFYSKDADVLFVVRLAQGLIGLAKGLVSLSPFHSDRMLMISTGTAGLLAVLFCCMDMKNTILDKYHYLLYFLVPSLNPRFIATLDENDKSVPLSIRVGQRVDTVGVAGRPKTISGFQTHTTPVLLAYTERAEFANTEHTTPASILEGVLVTEKAETEENTEMKE